jgi:hypothetical protein
LLRFQRFAMVDICDAWQFHITRQFFFKKTTVYLRQIDHSVVESFGAGGRAVITARVYPEHTATSSSHLFMFNNGTDAVRVSKLRAWELAPASVNAGDSGLILSELLKLQS